ncbi:DHA2 family efflux MFS transporter permease subunit [Sporomusa sp.]|uniref:DHA2 family efflux MFS transporter permease subunit n=1 Tax=Sporomusa sp. TaxID=2078658 RepID=UPI002B7FF5E2|nr:DHA2 family efflux MFS transporter permease subunit [Sporomusa sp.]HWR44546.1 DHA2 family efflux MFS transporter permease subunit [Sporomusa sp.]
MNTATARNQPNKYFVLFIVSLGTVLSGYVSSSLDIALSNMMSTFGFTMDSVTWVLLSYMIPYGATLPIMGKLGDQFGRKKMYVSGLVLFTIATMMVGLSWSSVTVIVFRILQGIGAAMFFPNAMTLVADAFPPNERGQAMGMWGALAAAGAVLGPTIGGYIVEYLNWRMLFNSIVPIAAVGIVLAITVLQESETNNTSAKIDYVGGVTLVTSLSSLIIILNRGAKEGWTSLYIVSLFIIMVVSMVAFLYAESHKEEPLVDLHLFKNTTFVAANIVGFLTFMALNGGLFLIPFFLRNILGYTPIHAGLALIPLIASMIFLAPMGGKLADTSGGKIPTMLGMLILSITLYSFHTMTADTSYPFIAIRLIFMGIGLALTMSPLSNAAMATLPKEKSGVGSGVFNLFKNVGGSVGIAILGTLLDQRQIFHNHILSSSIDASSSMAQQVIAGIQGGLMQSGMQSSQAYAAALSILQGMVSKQAAVMAYGDLFQIAAFLASLGVIAALLIRDIPKVGAGKAIEADEESIPVAIH